MHLLGQRLLGVMILLLLAALVTVKRRATGSVIDKPGGGFVVQLVNVFNLFFLLVVNPVAAVSLIAGRLDAIDPTHVTVVTPWLLLVLEVVGCLKYAAGFVVMAWALVRLGEHYQLGGSAPRAGDKLVTGGPYRFVRHPMYTAALGISFGLACLTQSLAFFLVFCAYVVLILLLIPLEEEGLRRAYGEEYAAYRRRTKRIIPFVY
jgi:protein-S-isoprenylcysteine O-methyltransferase Ste14